jgi:hypothetical protein
MDAQWTLSAHTSGQPDCEDSRSIAEAGMVEVEVQPSADVHSGTAQRLNDAILARGPQAIGVYGPWIYDRGHCCHPEIHPAEQIWWRDELSTTQRRYSFNVFCDASRRFWWRDQMDDGIKLKPWGAPPITGIFAVAFEVELDKGPATFEVATIEDRNVAAVPNGNRVYNLVHQGKNLVTFIPHNDAFSVSFEHVGSTGDNTVRGFLVLETTVGSLTQTSAIPPGQDVNTVDEQLEREAFRKVDGRYVFTVTQTSPSPINPLAGATVPTGGVLPG